LYNAGKALALLVHCGLKAGPATTDAPPLLWDDNYVTLLPGESRTVRTPISARDFGAGEPQVVVDGWNVSAEKVSKVAR